MSELWENLVITKIPFFICVGNKLL